MIFERSCWLRKGSRTGVYLLNSLGRLPLAPVWAKSLHLKFWGSKVKFSPLSFSFHCSVIPFLVFSKTSLEEKLHYDVGRGMRCAGTAFCWKEKSKFIGNLNLFLCPFLCQSLAAGWGWPQGQSPDVTVLFSHKCQSSHMKEWAGTHFITGQCFRRSLISTFVFHFGGRAVWPLTSCWIMCCSPLPLGRSWGCHNSHSTGHFRI